MLRVVILLCVCAGVATAQIIPVLNFHLAGVVGSFQRFNSGTNSTSLISTFRPNDQVVMFKTRCPTCYQDLVFYIANDASLGSIQCFSHNGGSLTFSATFNGDTKSMAVDISTGHPIFSGLFNGAGPGCSRVARLNVTSNVLYCLAPNDQSTQFGNLAMATWGGFSFPPSSGIGYYLDPYSFHNITGTNVVGAPESFTAYSAYNDAIIMASQNDFQSFGTSIGRLGYMDSSKTLITPWMTSSQISCLATHKITGVIYVFLQNSPYSQILGPGPTFANLGQLPNGGPTGTVMSCAIDYVMNRLYLGGNFNQLGLCGSQCKRIGYLDITAQLFYPIPGFSTSNNVDAMAIQYIGLKDQIIVTGAQSTIRLGRSFAQNVTVRASQTPVSGPCAFTIAVVGPGGVNVSRASFVVTEWSLAVSFNVTGTDIGNVTIMLVSVCDQYASVNISMQVIPAPGSIRQIPDRVYLTETVTGNLTFIPPPTTTLNYTIAISGVGTGTISPAYVVLPAGGAGTLFTFTATSAGAVVLTATELKGKAAAVSLAFTVVPQDSVTVQPLWQYTASHMFPDATTVIRLTYPTSVVGTTLVLGGCGTYFTCNVSSVALANQSSSAAFSVQGLTAGVGTLTFTDSGRHQYAPQSVSINVVATESIKLPTTTVVNLYDTDTTLTFKTSASHADVETWLDWVIVEGPGYGVLQSLGGDPFFSLSTSGGLVGTNLNGTVVGPVTFQITPRFVDGDRGRQYEFGVVNYTVTIRDPSATTTSTASTTGSPASSAGSTGTNQGLSTSSSAASAGSGTSTTTAAGTTTASSSTTSAATSTITATSGATASTASAGSAATNGDPSNSGGAAAIIAPAPAPSSGGSGIIIGAVIGALLVIILIVVVIVVLRKRKDGQPASKKDAAKGAFTPAQRAEFMYGLPSRGLVLSKAGRAAFNEAMGTPEHSLIMAVVDFMESKTGGGFDVATEVGRNIIKYAVAHQCGVQVVKMVIGRELNNMAGRRPSMDSMSSMRRPTLETNPVFNTASSVGDFAQLNTVSVGSLDSTTAPVVVEGPVDPPGARAGMGSVRSNSDAPSMSKGMASTMLRGNGAATQMLSAFAKIVGLTYLHETLAPIITEIVASVPDSFEVDPARLTDNDQLDINRWSLLANCQKVFIAIIKSIDRCPPQFYSICAYLQQEGMQMDEALRHSSVGGFIFLRFFCPAIIAPSTWGLVATVPDGANRLLVLIAKTMQNLSNNVRFGKKEEYMSKMNEFIDLNVSKLNAAFDELAASGRSDTSEVINMPADVYAATEDALAAYISASPIPVRETLVRNHPQDIAALAAFDRFIGTITQ